MPQRIQQLTGQGATLLYETPGMPGLVPSRAVLWSFHPDNPLNAVFDDHLQLVGYNVSSDDSGTSLLLFWYNRSVDSRAYNLFVHILDPQSGNMAGQADRPLGGLAHPTNAWRQGEIVFERVPLPSDVLNRLGKPYHIQLGLYQLSSGQRANAVSSDGTRLGDSIEIVVP